MVDRQPLEDECQSELIKIELTVGELAGVIDCLRFLRESKNELLKAAPPAPELLAYALTDAEKFAWGYREQIRRTVSRATDLILTLQHYQDRFPEVGER